MFRKSDRPLQRSNAEGWRNRGLLAEKPIIVCGKDGALWIRTLSPPYPVPWDRLHLVCPSVSARLPRFLPKKCFYSITWDSIFTEFCHQRVLYGCWVSKCDESFLYVLVGRRGGEKRWFHVLVSYWESATRSRPRWLKRCQIALISFDIFPVDMRGN